MNDRTAEPVSIAEELREIARVRPMSAGTRTRLEGVARRCDRMEHDLICVTDYCKKMFHQLFGKESL